jgi:hypothetical protein
MTTYVLTTPREAGVLIGRLLNVSPSCVIFVREEKAFKDGGWLHLGEISIHGSSRPDQLPDAVRRGAFEWKVPDAASAGEKLAALLGLKAQEKDAPKIRRALDAIAAIAVRAGLRHPRFDPHSLEGMPFRPSTTIVADTTGAIQGALDFVPAPRGTNQGPRNSPNGNR